jgi:hypothetical protein
VHWSLPVIEGTHDFATADELVAHLADLPAVGPEERKRRTCPAEHPNVDSLCDRYEELAQARPVRAQPELWRKEPAGKMNVRRGLLDLFSDPR